MARVNRSRLVVSAVLLAAVVAGVAIWNTDAKPSPQAAIGRGCRDSLDRAFSHNAVYLLDGVRSRCNDGKWEPVRAR